MTDDALKHTALHDWHVSAGGRMVDFAGWSLPVFYPRGSIEEHHLTRRSVGLFDIDHMGQIGVSGSQAAARLDRVVTSSVRTIAVGAARYGLLCNERGGVLDDVIVYRLDAEDFLVVVNAANREVDLAWIDSQVAGPGATVTDRSAELEMIAVQGPNSIDLLASVVDSPDAVRLLDRFAVTSMSLFGVRVLLARTGYTGEDGFEILIAAEHAPHVWDVLLARGDAYGILPCGLAARDSLRLEAGMPLHGAELTPERDPFSAGLHWAVKLTRATGDPHECVGAEALTEASVALESWREQPQNAPVDARILVGLLGNGRRAAHGERDEPGFQPH